jgi:hypothetical protein
VCDHETSWTTGPAAEPEEIKIKKIIREILIKLEFSRQIFKKSSNIKFNENTSSGSRVVHADGQTEGQK